MSAPICFIDTETTGLDPDLHEIWEVAIIFEHSGGRKCIMSDTSEGDGWLSRTWQLPVDLSRADSMALEIGHYHDRSAGRPADPYSFAQDFMQLTRGCHLAGNVVSFDEERLRKLLRANRACPGWHYHLIDIENMIAGYFGVRPPWKSEDLSRMLDIEPPSGDDLHTALGDARWCKAMYDKLMDLTDPWSDAVSQAYEAGYIKGQDDERGGVPKPTVTLLGGGPD